MDDMRQRVEAMRAHTETVNAGRKPKFGDRMRNLWAGESNPHRDATFFRTAHRTGRFNPGKWYEMTDENGRTWLQKPEGMIFLDLVPISDAMGGPFPTPSVVKQSLTATQHPRTDGGGHE